MWENVLKTLDLAKKISPDDNVLGEYITSIIGKIYNDKGPVYYNAYSEILKHIAEKYPEFISEEAKKNATEHFVEVLIGFAKTILDFSRVHQSIYSSIPDSIRKSKSADEYIRNIHIIEDKLPLFMNIYKILKHDVFLDLAHNNMGELAGTLGNVLQKLENSIESMKLEFNHDEQAMQLINKEERNLKTFREFFDIEFARYVPKIEEMQQKEQIPKQQEEQKKNKSGLFEGFKIVRKWFEKTKPSQATPASKGTKDQIRDDLD